MISQTELKQLSAFVRYDGFLLGVLMSVTFIMIVSSLVMPGLQLLAMACIVATPIFIGRRIGNYRDNILGRRVSFRRALYYALQCFLYGGLILAMVAFLYMKYVDDGMFLTSLSEALHQPEMQPVIDSYGLNATEVEEMLSVQRPIDIAFSLITNVLFTGFFASIFIAMFVRREPMRKE